MIYLHKILPVFVMPIMLIIYLLIFAMWKKKRWPIYTAIISLYIFSTPIFATNFFKLIEGNTLRQIPNNIPKADAIVILGGIINPVKSEHGFYPEWGDPDRLFGGIELFKFGKAPKIIISGGKLFWENASILESDILRKFCLNHGVPDSSILISNAVQNTEDEAKAVLNLIGKKKKIILVTSAYHMRRASLLFKSNKLYVTQYSVDFKTQILNSNTFLDFIPDFSSFGLFNKGYRELIGYLFYSLTISK